MLNAHHFTQSFFKNLKRIPLKRARQEALKLSRFAIQCGGYLNLSSCYYLMNLPVPGLFPLLRPKADIWQASKWALHFRWLRQD
jgi:hypothetical protein